MSSTTSFFDCRSVFERSAAMKLLPSGVDPASTLRVIRSFLAACQPGIAATDIQHGADTYLVLYVASPELFSNAGEADARINAVMEYLFQTLWTSEKKAALKLRTRLVEALGNAGSKIGAPVARLVDLLSREIRGVPNALSKPGDVGKNVGSAKVLGFSYLKMSVELDAAGRTGETCEIDVSDLTPQERARLEWLLAPYSTQQLELEFVLQDDGTRMVSGRSLLSALDQLEILTSEQSLSDSGPEPQ